MTCVLCGALLPTPHPDVVLRVAWVDGLRFQACDKHFPPDSAGDAAYAAAYAKFTAAAVERCESDAQNRPESAPNAP